MIASDGLTISEGVHEAIRCWSFVHYTMTIGARLLVEKPDGTIAEVIVHPDRQDQQPPPPDPPPLSWIRGPALWLLRRFGHRDFG
jgi:hypothetical protein